jgi:hypothetical protein
VGVGENPTFLLVRRVIGCVSWLWSDGGVVHSRPQARVVPTASARGVHILSPSRTHSVHGWGPPVVDSNSAVILMLSTGCRQAAGACAGDRVGPAKSACAA